MGAEEEFFWVFLGKINHSVEAHVKDTFGKIGGVNDESVGCFDNPLDVWAGFAVTRETDDVIFSLKNQAVRGNHGSVVDL